MKEGDQRRRKKVDVSARPCGLGSRAYTFLEIARARASKRLPECKGRGGEKAKRKGRGGGVPEPMG